MANAHHAEPTDHYTVFTVFAALLLGALTRHILKRLRLPYTVALLLLGIGVGVLATAIPTVSKYTTISNIDPHLLLFSFLPVLLFESAFSLDVHVFKKSFVSIITLAVPGVLMATYLTALLLQVTLPYGWSIWESLLLGAILSATDPVAVVSLLRELGASKQLATLIEGESLLNDGTAIVVFLVLKSIVIEENENTTGASTGVNPMDAVVRFLYVSVVGPFVGYVCGRLTVLWLSFVYLDAIVEITITLSSSYLTFFIAEEFFGVSGVLAVVTLGLYINAVGRTRISPEVEGFLHRFYEMLGYLANTLIFVLCGIVASNAATNIDSKDVFYLLLLYLFLHVVRAVVVATLSPILKWMNSDLTFNDGVVLVWGGLRGGVGLALGLLVAIEIGGEYGDKVLFYVAGIVVLTLVVNGTTTSPLLKFLNLNKPTFSKQLTKRFTAYHLRSQAHEKLEALKRDAFLGEADWGNVKKYWYMPEVPDIQLDTLGSKSVVGQLTRTVSFMLGRQSFKNRRRDKNDSVELGYTGQRDAGNTRSGASPAAAMAVNRFGESTAMQRMGARGRRRSTQHNAKDRAGMMRLRQMMEFRLAARQRYLKALKQNFWHQFEEGMLGQNAVLTLSSLVDDKLDVAYEMLTYEDLAPYLTMPETQMQLYENYKDWPILGGRVRNAMFLKLFFAFHIGLGFIRANEEVLKLIKTPNSRGGGGGGGGGGGNNNKDPAHSPHNHSSTGHHSHHGHGHGHDVSIEGFSLVSNPVIAQETREFCEFHVERVWRAILVLREAFPEIARAVKTVFASKQILNFQLDVVRRLHSAGTLEEDEADVFIKEIQARMKMLHFSPPAVKLPGRFERLTETSWLRGVDDQTVLAIAQAAELMEFHPGDYLIVEGTESDGLFLILSGVVRISIRDKVVATEGPGTSFGELSILTHEKRSASIRADTQVTALKLSDVTMLELMMKYPRVRTRLWEFASVKIGESVLKKHPEYQMINVTQLRMFLQSGNLVGLDDDVDEAEQLAILRQRRAKSQKNVGSGAGKATTAGGAGDEESDSDDDEHVFGSKKNLNKEEKDDAEENISDGSLKDQKTHELPNAVSPANDDRDGNDDEKWDNKKKRKSQVIDRYLDVQGLAIVLQGRVVDVATGRVHTDRAVIKGPCKVHWTRRVRLLHMKSSVPAFMGGRNNGGGAALMVPEDAQHAKRRAEQEMLAGGVRPSAMHVQTGLTAASNGLSLGSNNGDNGGGLEPFDRSLSVSVARSVSQGDGPLHTQTMSGVVPGSARGFSASPPAHLRSFQHSPQAQLQQQQIQHIQQQQQQQQQQQKQQLQVGGDDDDDDPRLLPVIRTPTGSMVPAVGKRLSISVQPQRVGTLSFPEQDNLDYSPSPRALPVVNAPRFSSARGSLLAHDENDSNGGWGTQVSTNSNNMNN